MKMDINLFEQPLDEVEETQKKTKIILEARATLARIAKFINKTGGEISEEDLAKTPLGDFVACAAQNSFSINLSSNTPYLTLPKRMVDTDCGLLGQK